MKRTLTLKREALAELTADDLAAVVGAAIPSGLTCPVADCYSDVVRCVDLTRTCW